MVNLEPTSLADIFDDIRRVAEACDVPERAEKLIGDLSERVENVRERAERIPDRPRCFLMEWVDPPFCSGHWGPELVEIAGGHDSLGRKHQPSAQIEWQQVLDARPEIIVLALCGYDIDRARRDYELLRRFPGFDSIPAALDRPDLRRKCQRVLRASRPSHCGQCGNSRGNFAPDRISRVRFARVRRPARGSDRLKQISNCEWRSKRSASCQQKRAATQRLVSRIQVDAPAKRPRPPKRSGFQPRLRRNDEAQ